MNRRRVAAAALTAAVALSACGGGDDDSDAQPATSTSAHAPTSTSVPDPAARGERLTEQRGCTSCHSTDGRARVGPTWQGLAGSQVTLKGGKTVTADDAYLKRSISDPDAEIVEGFPSGVMPGGIPGSKLTDAEIADIVAYLHTL